MDQIVDVRDELIVGELATLVEVWLVDKVPRSLEAVGALDVVSKGCALNEGVVHLSCDKTGV